MQGQKSCRHQWTRKVRFLGGRGRLFQCAKCRKMMIGWGHYPKVGRGKVTKDVEPEYPTS